MQNAMIQEIVTSTPTPAAIATSRTCPDKGLYDQSRAGNEVMQ
jgi:hypothetical protein